MKSGPASEPDTFPKLLLRHSAERGRKVAFCEKDLGIWQSWNWADVARNVRTLAAGLAARGFERGDKLAIVGDNRPRLYWTMAAAQALGGVPVPLYQDAVADEMAYTLTHAEANLAVAEDQEQVDKLREIRGRCPSLRAIFYDDPRGLARYGDPSLLSLDLLEEEGHAFATTHPRYVDEEIAKGSGRDVAIILYTSGTTGPPKGVMLTHDALITTARNGLEREGLGADEKMLAYLPMAWVGDHLFSYAQWLVAGFSINCPESGETVMTDLREIGPTYYFAPPR
ncbi:MAG TPA: AMP-binding protein, partial [Thermoanaerobaculia bacterium]|nr:AMP-binding protein [Thermoanaerobaculia bacterium]